ncbi:MAG: S8 family serine peptidase [candidate division Zixibacteria bacterium]|nr:S8 family serine peptidase [candidate division Zixibacteria bacterium]MDH3935727.1 S8 family serine peptidase [candidate division Zixibacteria bacterium]MDH4033736.1 S8 family serine peptidase [candidate division Zixibacteria bacterium]
MPRLLLLFAIIVSQGLAFDVVESETLPVSDGPIGGTHIRLARTQEAPEPEVSGSPILPLDKFTREAQATVAEGPYPNIYWLFVDSTAVAGQPIPLTTRARDRRAKVDPSRWLIDRSDYPIADTALQRIVDLGLTIRHASRYLKAVAVTADPAQIAQAATLPFVKQVHTLRSLMAPIPPEVKFDRGHHRKPAIDFGYGQSLTQNRILQADRLHQMGITGRGVMIGVFDTGFDTDHPALSGASIVARYDFINQDTSVSENECTGSGTQNYHGTLVHGVIAAFAADTMIGVAPDADFVLAKTEIVCGGTEIKLEEDNWIAAAEWADSIGADIITSSLSYTQFTDSGSYTLDDMDGNTALITIAADIAASKNIIVVTSAGNSRGTSWNSVGAPADGDSVLAIGAVWPDSTLAGFSSPGPTADGRIKPDVTTMGAAIYTIRPEPNGGFTFAQGTSFSAPLVAGGAALALQYDQSLTAEQFRQLARSTASQAESPDNDLGYGLFNAFRSSGVATLAEIDTIRVTVGELREVPFTVTGNNGTMPRLSLREPPAGVVLHDFGDGSGFLSVTGSSDNPPQVSFRLIAEFDRYSDSTTIYLETFVPTDRQVFAGPNPFIDSVRFFVDPSVGPLKSVSVFNVSGEKIWEKVNSHPGSTDSIREWTMLAWNGRNQQGDPAAAGVYMAVVTTGRQQVVLKLLKSN